VKAGGTLSAVSLWLIILTVLFVAVLLAVIFVAIGLFRRQRDAKAGAAPPPSLESPTPPPRAGGSSETG
jgi:hypothetical protein